MSGGPIRGTDRVADVLRRDETLVDVFTAVSPAFERLRKPGLRKVMARLVTVEQAARVAGVDPARLLERLNAAVSGIPASADDVSAEPGPAGGAAGPEEAAGNRPASLVGLSPENVVDVDVREALRAGEEPFSRIMAARRNVPDDGALRLRAIFEPVPLYDVMAKQGFRHWTERLAEDDWVVWFYRAPSPEQASVVRPEAGAPVPDAARETPDAKADAEVAAEAESGDPEGGGVVVLDVRGLEPPEPMVRTLAALEALPADATLVQINVREPRFLLPQLEERGFTYEVRPQGADLVRVFIRHAEST